MTENKRHIKPYPLGAHCEKDNLLRFSFVSKNENCGVILYDRKTGRKKCRLAFSQQERIGDIYCKYVEGENPADVTYQFYEGDKLVPDLRARTLVGRHVYGKERNIKDLRAGFISDDFDWGEDSRPRIPYSSCVVYCMHIRGFTRHASSGVEHKGTFLGVIEKIPYLKASGITTVELQPAYEFLEMPNQEERRSAFHTDMVVSDEELDMYCPRKLNYWGYKQGYYYAPKSAYAYGDDASVEFKEMVKAFHAAGMEVVMQFYFPKETERHEIAEILRFWLLTYHIDGFHLMGEGIPTAEIARDSALTDTKLWYYSFDTDNIYRPGEVPAYRNLAEYRDGYYYDMRRFLKGDENMLTNVLGHMRYNPLKCGVINYFTNYYGFTMMDMVSYDRKHNDENGEDNRDGSDMNCSWNCGEEGKSRRKRVVKLRRRQIKNAMCMLLFSQGTPLIFMGDEFGNSQNGNNNPYCQDNAITWLDWRGLDANRDLYDFWTTLIRVRREHPVLHMDKAFVMMDSISCGYPDLSYHGQNAWRAQLEGYNRHVGIMYCGKYARREDGGEDSIIYLAMNMYWMPERLALPKLPKGMRWKQILDTAEEKGDGVLMKAEEHDIRQTEETECTLPERSIALLVAVNGDEADGGAVNGKLNRHTKEIGKKRNGTA